MGTPDFAVPTLEKLIEHHNVVAVVSQPDKPKGRGKKLVPTPVKEFALNNGITNILQPTSIKDESFIPELEKLNADIFVVAAYGQILTEKVLNIPKYRCINVHGSLLPKYRGAAPIQWSIINGEEKTGVTIMYMEKGLDSGDMILKKEIEITKDDTYKSLHDKMSIVGADALIEALNLIETGKCNPEKQDDSISTYAPMISKETGHINWDNSSKNIINLIRGLNPIPMAYTIYNNEIFKIYKAEEINGYNGKIGEIIDIINKKGFVVKTKDSALLITEIQAKNGKRMNTSDYLRGHTIDKGIVLC
ncbi:MAG: methionyl-tRNA formyltransferase [Eubacteriales bacterium]|nr:methionyl-tRNA formyltransferase [Eubacteriales bacterium]